MSVTLVWFRQDLRLDDNPALAAAGARGAVVPIYIWSPGEEGEWEPGAASKVWLHHSLASLQRGLEAIGSSLILRAGDSLEELRRAAAECGASAVYWNRRYEPAAIERDRDVKARLSAEGIEALSFKGSLLWEPWEAKTSSGGPFKVFTPFWKARVNRQAPERPIPAPDRLDSPARQPASLRLNRLGLLPAIDWAGGIREAWEPGEPGAEKALNVFLGRAADYADRRNRPDLEGTSRLSPHLHFGEISPRRVWRTVAKTAEGEAEESAWAFLREIAWREFAHHLLYHFPATPTQPLRPEFERFPWSDDREAFCRWRRGETGYPIVDAGLRELWRTGWMHNRVRMIAASFLVKDLLAPWRWGAEWFWDTLVDADLANNTLGWQWTAGCGADAAPYFRIFNPAAQGRRFDPAGDYVRRHVPELRGLSSEWIHEPWKASASVLSAAGVRLDNSYPRPLVDHADARRAALDAYQSLKQSAAD